ncbi:hypothetical protein BDV24DRAFT_156834 [Aspergillus arachidicola]|uniref:Uncharacterized protein n=1 Tax=Aspergillus arachidicola TaxID=656916 RepID=A0A5N6XSB2_9EURO|nr:hypothetical protein BDV24DRAFT_156834 [Aspergillus arachidicola]
MLVPLEERKICKYTGGSRYKELSYIILDSLLLAYTAAAHYSRSIPEGLPGKRDETMLFQITDFAVNNSPKYNIIANHYKNGETAVYTDNANYKINNFIGFAETEHAANFYYRIIPEIKGFGTNYETVNIYSGIVLYL